MDKVIQVIETLVGWLSLRRSAPVAVVASVLMFALIGAVGAQDTPTPTVTDTPTVTPTPTITPTPTLDVFVYSTIAVGETGTYQPVAYEYRLTVGDVLTVAVGGIQVLLLLALLYMSTKRP